jgi:hypothetical protein
MKMNMIKGLTPTIHVIGAKSIEIGLVSFEILQDHNNAEVFMNFMNALKSKCEGMKVLVVLDNYSIHYSKNFG